MSGFASAMQPSLAQGRYSSASEYVRELIRADEKRKGGRQEADADPVAQPGRRPVFGR